MRTYCSALMFMLVALSVQHASAEDDGSHSALAIVGVNVIPMDTDRILENRTVIVRDGRIEAIGAAADLAVPDGARLIAGDGRYLMPGLADLHVHVRRSDEYISYLAWGVTTIMHLGGSASRGRELLDNRRRIVAGEMTGPNLYITERLLDGDPPTGGNQLPLASPDAAREKVASMKAAGFDFVKIYNNVPLPVFRAIIEEAARQDMPVFGHIPRGFDPLLAMRDGQDAVVHTEEFFFTYFKGPRSTEGMDRSYRPDLSLIPRLLVALLEGQVTVIPNLSYGFTTFLMWDGLDNVWTRP